jgi:hypothetical protein
MAGEESAKEITIEAVVSRGKIILRIIFFLKMKLTILRKAECSSKRKAAMDRGRILAVKFVG